MLKTIIVQGICPGIFLIRKYQLLPEGPKLGEKCGS